MHEIKEKNNYSSYDLIRNIDKDLRKIKNDLFIFRSEHNSRLTSIKNLLNKHDKDISNLNASVAVLQNNVSELKNDVKGLQRDVSDIKGDIKALSTGFNIAQNRFNWGLVILGIIVALIQLLK